MMMRLITMLNSTVPGGEGNETTSKIYDILHNVVDGTLMPIIYIVLGLFLVVKGAILGMQIVKAADEPQVRQEKIGALKWLVIGVAIAYGVTVAADIVIGYFADTMAAESGAQ